MHRKVRDFENRDQRWNPLTSPFLKLNCDSSFKLNYSYCGIGLILRNFAGEYRGSRCIARQDVLSAEEEECFVVLDEVQWTLERQVEHICIEVDSSNIANAINGNNPSLSW